MRFIAVLRDGDEPFAVVCKRFEISRKTGYKWLARYEQGGPGALVDGEPVARQCRHATPSAVVDAVIEARKAHPFWGPKKLRSWLSEREPTLAFDITKSTFIGLAARCGVYRVRNVNEVLWFLNAPDPSILRSLTTKVRIEAPRYTRRFVTPQHHAVVVRLFGQPGSGRASNAAPAAFIPATNRQEIIAVAPRGRDVRPETLAEVPWKLFGRGPRSTDQWFEVKPLDPLSRVLT